VTGGFSQWRQGRGGPVSVRMPADDLSRVGEIRRAADALAIQCGLDEEARGLLGVVVTETVTNLARHARNGIVLLRDTEPMDGRKGVEVVGVDSGPGMLDVRAHATDGFSTGGTSGTGLGAIRRLAHEMDIHSVPGTGTVLVARVFSTEHVRNGRPESLVDVGVVCLPVDGETACGDGWSVSQTKDRAVVLVVDGLGHGTSAADAADAACATFEKQVDHQPGEILQAVHESLRATRGAAVLVAQIIRMDDGARVTVAGAGNVASSIVMPGGSRALPSMNGTAGLQLRGVREFSADWTNPGRLVINSDGITTRWRLDSYPGILGHDPSLAAALIHRDFTRGRDDATVVVLGLRGSRTP
jgi:anti-sigma regulatory factor (Ser/Thr protein kinase)